MKKRYLIVGSVLLVYVIMMIIIFGTDLFKNKTYIMIGADEKLKYEHGKYVDIKDSEKSLYQGQNFDIYDETGHLGIYQLKYHQGRWHAFADDYSFVKLTEPIFAIKSNKKYSVPTYSVGNLNSEDIKVLNSMLKEEGITNYNLMLNQKIMIDLDNDGKNESLYSVSNLFEDEGADGYFSLVYYVKNDKVKILKKKIVGLDDAYDSEQYYLTKLIDLKNDKKLEIVVTRTCYSLSCDDCSEIYTWKWGNYKKLRTCE